MTAEDSIMVDALADAVAGTSDTPRKPVLVCPRK